MNQLVRDDASEIGITTVYVYDNGGNLTNKKFYSYTEAADVTTSTEYGGVSFGYNDTNWTDKMTSYLGNTVTYDEIGNPINYDGYSFSWTGRQLDSATGYGKNITYKYDVNGLRTSKTVNGVTSNYQYVNGKLYFENKNGYDIYYHYDSFGNLAAIKTKKTGTNDALVNYLVTTNFRGDVEGIYNDAGELLANYKYYDAWGSYVVAKDAQGNDFYDPTHIASLNSIKYRGYYQDSDTGYYYLQSRYYDAYAGRFINADGMISTGEEILGENMFTYCYNNPVNLCDQNGACPSNFIGPCPGKDKCSYFLTNSSKTSGFLNTDGSYSLYDNKRNKRLRAKGVFHEQIFSVKASQTPGFSLNNKKISLGSYKVNIMTGGWEWKHVDLSLLDIGSAKFSAGIHDNKFDVSAMASVWDGSVVLKFPNFKVSLSAHAGSIGGQATIGQGEVSIKAAAMYGAGISVTW